MLSPPVQGFGGERGELVHVCESETTMDNNFLKIKLAKSATWEVPWVAAGTALNLFVCMRCLFNQQLQSATVFILVHPNEACPLIWYLPAV